MKYIDLHVHTYFSDGLNSPKEVLEMAIENKTKYISITDHNSILGNLEARELIKNNNLDIEIIKGIEIDSNYKDELYDTFHVLGYNCDDKKIQKYLDKLEEKNIKFFYDTFEFLKKNFNNKMSLEEFNSMYKTITSRPEQRIMDYLKAKKFVENRHDLYKKFNIKNNFDSIYDVVKLIKNCDGVPILAHPSRYESRYNYSKEELSSLVLELKEYGLVGVEAIYSTNTNEQTEFWKQFTAKNGLIYTAGTDFHQIAEEERKVKIEISKGNQGNMYVSDENIVTNLKEKMLKY